MVGYRPLPPVIIDRTTRKEPTMRTHSTLNGFTAFAIIVEELNELGFEKSNMAQMTPTGIII